MLNMWSWLISLFPLVPTVTLREVPCLRLPPLMCGTDPEPTPNDAEDSPGPSVKPSPRNSKVHDVRGSDPHTYD